MIHRSLFPIVVFDEVRALRACPNFVFLFALLISSCVDITVSLGKYLSLIVEIASSNLRISACRTAERSERMSFVSLARSASVPPPTGVALVTTFC